MEQKKTSGSKLLTVILVGLAALLSVTILVVILLQHFRPDTETPSSGVSVSTEAVPATETALETEGPAVTEGTAETETAFETEAAPETEPAPTTAAAQKKLPDTLSSALDDALSDADGEWAVYVEALQTGEVLRKGKNADCAQKMISASIVKIFAMAATYDRVERGTLTMTDALQSNLSSMITVSGNSATNSVLATLGGGSETAGMKAVKDYALSIGCGASEFNRLMGVENGLENYISADDCAVLLRMIYNGTCVSPECSEEMMQLLLENVYADFIPAGVPDGVAVAHKGGDLDVRCRGDVGIVFLQDNPYIVCIIANNVPSAGDACRKIPVISEIIYSAMASAA